MVKMGTVWDRTAEFLSDNVAAIVPIALLTFFVPMSVMGSLPPEVAVSNPTWMVTLAIVQLALALVVFWGSLAITVMALDVVSVEGQTAKSIATRRLFPTLLVWIVLFVLLIGALQPVPFILMAAGVDVQEVARNGTVSLPYSAGWLLVGYFLLVSALFLWASARLAVVVPVILRERKSFGALRRSWQLTRGHAPRIIGVLILYVVIAIVSWFAALLVFGSIFQLILGSGDGVTLASVMTSIVVAAVQSAFMVIPPAFTAKLYLALADAGPRHAEAGA